MVVGQIGQHVLATAAAALRLNFSLGRAGPPLGSFGHLGPPPPVTWMLTTAGLTRSTMSANDSGRPAIGLELRLHALRREADQDCGDAQPTADRREARRRGPALGRDG